MKSWIKDHIFTSIGIAVCCALFLALIAIDMDEYDDYGYYQGYYDDDYYLSDLEYDLSDIDIEDGIWTLNATANAAVQRYNEMFPDTPIEPYQVSSSRYGNEWEGSVNDGTLTIDFEILGNEDYITISSDMNYNEATAAIFQEKSIKWIAAIFDVPQSEAEMVMTPLFRGITREIDPGREWYTYYKNQTIYYEINGYSHNYQITMYGRF